MHVCVHRLSQMKQHCCYTTNITKLYISKLIDAQNLNSDTINSISPGSACLCFSYNIKTERGLRMRPLTVLNHMVILQCNVVIHQYISTLKLPLMICWHCEMPLGFRLKICWYWLRLKLQTALFFVCACVMINVCGWWGWWQLAYYSMHSSGANPIVHNLPVCEWNSVWCFIGKLVHSVDNCVKLHYNWIIILLALFNVLCECLPGYCCLMQQPTSTSQFWWT